MPYLTAHQGLLEKRVHDAMPERSAGTSAHESRAGLGLRLALALGASALAGIVLERLLVGVVPVDAMRYLVSSLVATGLVGVALYHLVVSPLAKSRADLTVRYEAALADALADPLTGLGNHRAFQEELDRQVDAAQRYGAPVSLVLIDLDDFKAINDTKGHAFGDEALTHFGALVKRGLRRVDRPFRVGGDEFAILLPQTDAEAAKIVIRRLLASALQPALRSHVDPGSLSFSAGISALPESPPGAPSCTASRCGAVRRQARRAHRGHGLRPRGDSHRRSQRAGGGGGRGRGPAWLRPVYQPIMELKTGRCWASRA